ncbi:MAG: hypothetical protein JWP27_2764 [Flaviaesturariibacter sp.]|nr:hypothetical protein [Flaviaesturariibacter sp.]
MRSLLTALILCIFLAACTYHSEESLYSNSPCNTTNVTYSTTVAGIINANGCLNCHGPVNPTGGFSLNDYAGVKAKVTDGRLYGAVNHSPGFSPMPQGSIRMNQCQIDQLKSWIDHGAPNN